LYHRPRTRFVAGFIGSPAMNFIPCRLVNGGDSLSLRLSDQITLPVPADRKARFAPYKDKAMLLGLRPEHLTELREQGKENVVRMDVDLDVTEPMGMETLVHFHIDGTPLCGRVDPSAPAVPGTRMPMSADLNHLHLIEPESGVIV